MKEEEKKTKIITCASNLLMKHRVKLRRAPPFTAPQSSSLVVGLTPILEICRFQELYNDELPIVDYLHLLDGVVSPERLNDSCSSVVHVSSNVMKKLSGMQSIDSTEGIALVRIPRSFYVLDGNQEKEEIHWSFLTSPHPILVLDGI